MSSPPPSPSRSPVRETQAANAALGRDVLLTVGCAALAAGVGEVALRFLLLPLRGLMGNRVYLDPNAIWMAPLVNAALMLVPTALAAWGVRRWKGQDWGFAASVLVAGFLALFAVAMVTRRLSDMALAALSLGIASQLARFALSRPRVARRILTASGIVLGLVVLGVTLVTRGGRWWREQRAEAALPLAAGGAPNVLLLVLDTVRGMELGFNGYTRRTTPNLDRWAARGAVFEHAFAPSPWTLPTHATLFTGRWPHELSVGWASPLDKSHPTIGERLTALGYNTAGFAANTVFASYLFGLNRGFITYRDYQPSPSSLIGSSTLGRRLIEGWNTLRGTYVWVGRKDAAEVNAEVKHWLHRVHGKRPWFAFVNYFDAHDPYDPPAPFHEMFPGTKQEYRSLVTLRVRPPEELQALQAAYDGAIAWLDSQVGKLLDDLESEGMLDNTLVIITSDHGEEFGEHTITGHGSSLYSPVLRVPLVVIRPGEVMPQRVSRMVTLRDIAATIEEAARPAERTLPGIPLSPLWRGDTLHRVSPILSEVQRLGSLPERYPIAAADLQSIIVQQRWHFIRSSSGKEELFDVQADPLERENLIGSTALAPIRRLARDSLARVMDNP